MSLTGGTKPVDDSTPVSTGAFNDLKPFVDARFDELKNLILALQPKTTDTSAPPIPKNMSTNSHKDGKLEEEGEELGDDKYNVSPKHKPSKENGSGKFSAVSGPTYTGPPLPSPHYAHVGNPPMLDASSFANW